MATVESVVLEATEPADTAQFITEALGVSDRVGARGSGEPGSGFRGFALSLVVSQPSTVDSLVATALDSGATTAERVKRSLWGYGGVVQAPDGTLWKIATSSKKESGPPTRQVDDIVLLLGVEDVKASRRFYVDRGLVVAKSFGGKYVQFESSPTGITLALLRRDAGEGCRRLHRRQRLPRDRHPQRRRDLCRPRRLRVGGHRVTATT